MTCHVGTWSVLRTRRPHYRESSLMSGKFHETADPIALFAAWLGDAEASEPSDPTAMALATVDESGLPNVRMVLLKQFDASGFAFYTNRESAKGTELLANAKAAACFHWKSRRRQVRLRGPVEEVTGEEADAYFASRARHSRIGAWASQQSRPLATRFALEKAVASYAAKYAVGEVPRPAYWSGFRIRPQTIEFWQDGAFRLHDRIAFNSDGQGGWTGTRLFP
ncbi:MAG: pyridoxamine 5'-phosphate oxidase [Alphaproteobacteria bacterium]